MTELAARATVLAQRADSVFRRKGKCQVQLDESGLTALYGRRQAIFLNLKPGCLDSASLVDELKGRMSTFTPPRGKVLKLDVNTSNGLLTIGIVVPDDDAEDWLQAADSVLRTADSG